MELNNLLTGYIKQTYLDLHPEIDETLFWGDIEKAMSCLYEDMGTFGINNGYDFPNLPEEVFSKIWDEDTFKWSLYADRLPKFFPQFFDVWYNTDNPNRFSLKWHLLYKDMNKNLSHKKDIWEKDYLIYKTIKRDSYWEFCDMATLIKDFPKSFPIWFDKDRWDWDYNSKTLAINFPDYFELWFDKGTYNYTEEGSIALAKYCHKDCDKWWNNKDFDWSVESIEMLIEHCSNEKHIWGADYLKRKMRGEFK